MTRRASRPRSGSSPRSEGMALAAFLCALVLCAATARAATPVELVQSHFRARGGEARLLKQDFLFEGQALVQSIVVPKAGCWAVFAWGGTGLRDVDLGIYSLAGQLLAEDRGATPYGYARLCSAQGLNAYISAQAYAGRGELTLFWVEQAPRELGRLPESLPIAVSQGGRASPPRALGGDETELAFEAPLLHDERLLATQGYSALGPANVLDVRAGLAQGTLMLRANTCFRLVAFVPSARGMMIEVEGALLKREGRSADAELLRLALCTTHEGPHIVRVRTRAMRSVALLRLFEHRLATTADAMTYGEERALLLGEARYAALERGLTLQHLGEAWLEGGSTLLWPVELRASECQMLIALPERTLETELRLLNADGVVVASNEGRRGAPSLFTCAKTSEKLRLLLRGRGAPGPVSLWFARGVAP